MKKKTKGILIGASIILIAVLAVIGFFVVKHNLSQKEYSVQMKVADKYLSESDYDNAILAYEKALKADPKKADVYVQLATIYVKLDNPGRAEYYLKLGIKKASGTGKLQFMLNKILDSKNISNETIEPEETEEEESEDKEAYTVKGIIVNAVTGEGVADVTVTATRTDGEESEDSSADQVLSVRTKANGSYELVLLPGSYDILANSEGFIEEHFQLDVKEKNITAQNFTVSPELQTGEIRIVLEWGSTPGDLDAYLFENSVNNSSPVYYGSTGSSQKGAELDVDDRNGFGPETITITNTSKTWVYGVQDFTMSDNGLAASGVTVKVYLPGQSPKVYTAPSGEGNYWTVCKIQNGQVTDIGKMDENQFIQ